MTALKPGDLDQDRNKPVRWIHKRKLECDVRIPAPGTSYVKGPVLFGIEIDQGFSRDEFLGEHAGPGKARFLLDRKEHLQVRVDKRGVFHDGEHGSHADPVIGPQRGPVGFYPLPVPNEPDRVS